LYLTENVQDKKITGFDKNKAFKLDELNEANTILENIGQYGASLLFATNENRLSISAYEVTKTEGLKRTVYIDTDDEGPKDYAEYAVYMYDKGLYRSKIVETADGMAFLKALGIHKNPFSVFEDKQSSEEATKSKKKKRKMKESRMQTDTNSMPKQEQGNTCDASAKTTSAQEMKALSYDEVIDKYSTSLDMKLINGPQSNGGVFVSQESEKALQELKGRRLIKVGKDKTSLEKTLKGKSIIERMSFRSGIGVLTEPVVVQMSPVILLLSLITP